MDRMIRPVLPSDIPAILAIWNPIIRDTAITFTSVEKTAADIEALIADRAAAGFPFLIAGPTEAIGFATCGDFRPGPGYRETAEHTVLLAPAARRQGTGRALMLALEDHARAAGLHCLIGGVSSGNPGGIAFHRAIGFSDTVILPEVGRKFGKRWDLVLMQKFLS